VTIVNQKAALAFGALAGAAAAALLGRRRPRALARAAPPADPRAEELRRKLDEARQADVDESEFNVAGMAAETIVPDEPGRRDPLPANEFEAMRQRVHEEARAAAEEMRRQAETDA
jgi:hypothetical protein